MRNLPAILSKKWLPLCYFSLFILVTVFHLSGPELVQEEDGLGWDGEVFASYIKEFNQLITQRQIEPYGFQRTLPLGIVYGSLTALNFPLDNAHIIKTFFILNCILQLSSILAWINIADRLRLSAASNLIGFTGLFVNFPFLKLPYYYPVLTDTFAFWLGMVILFCYLHQYYKLMLLFVFAGAFSHPTILYWGLFLFVFPASHSPLPIDESKSPVDRWLPVGLTLGFLVFILIMRRFGLTYIINPMNAASWVLSVAGLMAYVYLATRPLVRWKTYRETLRTIWLSKRLWIAAGVLLLVRIIILFAAKDVPPRLNYKGFLSHITLAAISNPLCFLVSHFVYFGPVLLLLIYYWKDVVRTINRLGMGWHGLTFAFVLLGVGSESRQYLNVWPFFVAALCLTLEHYRFPKLFYGLVLVFSLGWSRFWYRINQEPFRGDFLDFPYQRYFMFQGPWLGDYMYYVQGGVLILSFGLLYVLFLRNSVKRDHLEAIK